MYKPSGIRARTRTKVRVGAQEAAGVEVGVPLLLVGAPKMFAASLLLPIKELRQVHSLIISSKLNNKASTSSFK